MTALRVTTQLLVDRSVRNINNQTNRLLTLQEQLATGLRVNRPSDDPIDARRAVSIRSLIGKNEQYLANISMVNSPVAETNTSIETILSSFNRAWELTLRGANGTNAQSQLDALALEIDQILEGIFSTANHETNGRYLFGGTRTTAPPYEAVRNAEGEITAVNFVGNTEAVRVAISDVLDLQYNETGPDVFSETQDIFQTLIDVRDNLRAGDTGALGSVRLEEMETVRVQLTSALARVGSIQNRLDRSVEEFEEFTFQLQTQLSDAID
ncbi:MAG TPA: flagellar hook-associated protein FlgL, partial [Candidatus Hydrogenedentes bacterium]|nr:flagellar hook-associated protein FlgL [Candidatus Hydrogenedentota bacterium]